MAVTVGAVYVDVLPTTRDFVKQMVADILPEADKAGEEIGKRVGEGFDKQVKKEIEKSIEEGVEEADPEDEAGKKGKKAGGAFAKTFKAELEVALRSLPDVDIDGDNTGALAEVAEIRVALESLSKQTVGVTIDAEDGLRAVRRIREDLLAIQDRTIDVDFDIDQALASLGGLEKRMLRTFQDSQGSFARSIRGAIDSAVRALPEIELTSDITDVEQDLAAVRSWLTELGDKRIDIDIPTSELLAEIAKIDAVLSSVMGPHTLRVQADLDAARAALSKFTQQATEDIAEVGTRSAGAFLERWRRELTKAAETLPDIEVGADTSPALAQVADLRARLLNLAARIGVDVDGAQAFVELAQLQAAAEAVDRYDIDIAARTDLGNVIAQMTALSGAAATTAEAVDEAVGERAAVRVGRFRLILGAVVALLPLIAGAVIALPAAFAAIVGPAAAVALGTQGIVNAFNELTPVVNELKKSTAEAFQEGLEPTIGRLQQAIPGLADDFIRTAEAISFVAEQITITATSARGLNGIQDNFYLLNEIVREAAPGLQLLTDNIIRLTTIGLRGMSTFGEEMRQVGVAWQGVIDRLQASGAGEAAVRALFQVLAELLNLAAGLTEFGAVLGAAFGPALAAAISGIAQIFSTLAGVLDSLPQPLQTVASIAAVVGLAMAVLGTRVTAAAVAMRTGLVAAGTAVVTTFRLVSGIMAGSSGSILGVSAAARVAGVSLGVLAAAGRTLLTLLGGPIGIAITAVVVGLSLLGQGQAEASAAAEAHKAAVEQLSSALQASGGVIDSQVVKLTTSTLESKNLGAEMALLGESVGGVALKIAQGGPQYDALIAHLQGVVAAGTEMAFSGTEVTTRLTEEGQAAQTLLDAIGPMRQSFLDAAAANQQLAQNLFNTGQSLVTGAGDAKVMEEAFATLKNEMSSVKEIGDALYITMIQLSGQAIPLGLAQGQLGQAVRDTGAAFKAYAEATKQSGDSLLDHTGKINVASEAGFKLTQELDGLAKATYNSATAAFDAAGGINNIEVASAAAGREVGFARQKFIEMVGQFGITGLAAERLADDYGLIPDLVVTQLRAEGIPQAEQDILKIGQLVQAVPGQKVINIGVPSQEAISRLQALGLEIRKTVDGGYEVVLHDQAARDRLTGLIDTILHPPGGQPNVPTGLNTGPAEVDRKHLTDGISHGDPVKQPTGLNTDPAAQDQKNLTGGIDNSAPAKQPTELDTTKVQPQIDAIQGQVLGAVATMPINPIKGSGWDPDLVLIRDSVLQTVAQMPIDAMKSVNFDAQIQYIKTTLAQGIAATLPIDPVQSPNWHPALQTIKDSLALPPYTALLITVARAPTWAVDLAAITGPLNLPPYTTLMITVARAPTWAFDLAAITGPLMLPPYTPLMLIPAKAPEWQLTIDTWRTEFATQPLVWTVVGDFIQMQIDMEAIYNFIVPVPLIWTVIGDFAQMVADMTAIYNFIVPVPLIWVVIGDFSLMVQGLTDIYNWVAQNPLYWQIIPVFGGFGGGGGGGGGGTGGGMAWAAMGAIIQMASGGVINKALTPMRNDVATVVPPNTWRVVGDRQVGAEAFIPLVNKRRSHSILEYAAAMMGRTILPQAQGSIVASPSMTAGTFAGGASAEWASTVPEGGSSWRDRQAPLIGTLVASPQASATDLADEVMFKLRVADYGGLHGVGR